MAIYGSFEYTALVTSPLLQGYLRDLSCHSTSICHSPTCGSASLVVRCRRCAVSEGRTFLCSPTFQELPRASNLPHSDTDCLGQEMGSENKRRLSTSQGQSLNRLVSLGGANCLGFLGSGLLRKRWHKFEFVSGSSKSNRTS